MNFNHVPVSITPVQLSSNYASSFRYAVLDFDAFNQITFSCLLYNENGTYIGSTNVELNGCDYANWGRDDSYLIKYISNKLGFTPTNIMRPPNHCLMYAHDTSGNAIQYHYLFADGSGNLLLPDTFTRDVNGVIMNQSAAPALFEYLGYDVEGDPMPHDPLILDGSNNPILPDGYMVDSNGYVRDSSGQYIVVL
jgi:hypothetical protein